MNTVYEESLKPLSLFSREKLGGGYLHILLT
jgi:hypothetical protein